VVLNTEIHNHESPRYFVVHLHGVLWLLGGAGVGTLNFAWVLILPVLYWMLPRRLVDLYGANLAIAFTGYPYGDKPRVPNNASEAKAIS
jgi:hypothetical protein